MDEFSNKLKNMNNLYRQKQPKPLSRAAIMFGLPKIRRVQTTVPGSIGLTRTSSITELNTPGSDRQLMNELGKKVEEQRKDLEERSIALESLGKHFEAIGNACREEKNKNIELREKNMELQKENSSLKRHIGELKEKNEAEQSLNNQEKLLSSKLKENQADLTNEIKKLNQVIIDKTRENNDWERVCKKLEHEIAVSKGQMQRLDKKLQEATDDLAEEKLKLIDELNHLKKANETLKDEISQVRKSKSDLESQNSKLNEKVIILQENLNNVESQLEISSSMISELKEALKKMQAENQNKTQAVNQISVNSDDDLRQKLEEFQKQAYSLGDQLYSMTKQKNDAEDKLERSMNSRYELLASVEELRKKQQIESFRYEKLIQTISQDLKVKTLEIREMEENIKKNENQIKSYSENLRHLGEEINTKNSQIAESNGKCEDLISEIDALNKEKLEKEKNFQEFQEKALKFDQIIKELKENKEENSSMKSKFKKLEKSLEEAMRKKERLKLKYKDQESLFQAKIYELQAELNNEKNFNSSHLQEVIKLKRELSQREKPIQFSPIKEDQNRLQARIAQLEIECAELKEEILNHLKAQEYMKTMSLSQTQIISQLESQLEDAKSQLNDPKFKDLKKQLELLREKEENLPKVIEKLDHAMSAFESDFSCMNCLNLVEEAVFTIPCGHILCRKCSRISDSTCSQCCVKVQAFARATLLDELVGKLIYLRQTIDILL
ncbi:unnamed protein product [Blepharisma stoltei]|uniref:RING-type domain-containing protein n=1 Tax=Blepharisma stoltei TaxID=1481888 RepID=A0AAU9JVH7_9CILI|nr:unnamed protein product [Blepharisma stoltei]